MKFMSFHFLERIMLVGLSAALVGWSQAAEPTISVSARQRYPWNGLVDVRFTITGESGVKYDTSFTATDVAGGTNLTLKTLYKADGAVANPAKEQLLPGTYSWVWDAQADCSAQNYGRVKMSVEAKKTHSLYMVIDLSGGAKATSYPVSYLDDVPPGGWGDSHKSKMLVLRYCPPGEFLMQGRRRVHLTKPFYIGIFEMTERQVFQIMGHYYAYSLIDTTAGASTAACGCISYNTARGSSSGTKWPSSSSVDSASIIGKIRAKTGLGIDLPTEAQWEYACRAGTTSLYNDGSSSSSKLSNLAYYGTGGEIASGVGRRAANAWGVYDMHGNVCEWVLDWYGTLDDSEVTDPKGPSSGSKRICRGGGFSDSADNCTSNTRIAVSPNLGTYYAPDYTCDVCDQGIRVCLTLE